jgi:hypothetical protein
MNTTIAISGAALLFLTVACSSTPERTSTGSAEVALATVDPTTTLAGTWGFVLDASDAASKVRAACEADSRGDTSRAQACYAEVKAEGATEKLRFTKDAAGRTVWTSFGDKGGGQEELFLEATFDLSSEGPTRVGAKVAGPARGKQAENAGLHIGDTWHFDILDEHTIAMTDPHKGRLVFTRISDR